MSRPSCAFCLWEPASSCHVSQGMEEESRVGAICSTKCSTFIASPNAVRHSVSILCHFPHRECGVHREIEYLAGSPSVRR